jgi:membrane fusion protein, multidrug efflux system
VSLMPFNRRWTVAILGGTAIVVGVGFLGVRKAPADTHARNGVPAAVPVAVASVGREDVPVRLSGLGSVAAFNTVTVRPRVDGQLMRVLFREGQFVKRGDLLAEIDPRPFQVQLEQAQGQLAKDQAQLANARLDLTRYQTLLQEDSIARQNVDVQGDGAVRTVHSDDSWAEAGVRTGPPAKALRARRRARSSV